VKNWLPPSALTAGWGLTINPRNELAMPVMIENYQGEDPKGST
jgi:hypothetical protein